VAFYIPENWYQGFPCYWIWLLAQRLDHVATQFVRRRRDRNMNPFRALFLMVSRMPPAVMLAFIVGLAVTVTFAVTERMKQNEKDYNDKTEKITKQLTEKGKVVYVIKDIAEGQTIPSEALEERQIEIAKVPVDAITSASLAAGRVAKYGVSTGQLISQHDLAALGNSIGFEARLKPGMRAVTFAVDNNSGVAGFVAPESHVDIIGMVGSGPDTKARPLLSDVEVIAVGQTYQKGPGTSGAVPASSITVAVNPDDTQKLIKGVVAGKLYLSLRSNQDHTPVATVDITSLFAKPVQQAQSMTTLASLPPPPSLNLPPVTEGNSQALTAQTSAANVPPPIHEIEAWSGSKKDVISVPAN
jgi:pilus assembly protein CpaB